MESTFDEWKPRFSFKLKDGVTDSRTGMCILEKEGVMEVLRKAAGNDDNRG
ncbi:hypothetical protein [Daejeonella sp.]|uniref:hypothetical protein n=1 Tax=Daejeonella sp. TaxID=2805397 RepID=UPI0030BF420E